MSEPIFIAGPCVIESAEVLDEVAARISEINRKLGTDIIFKSSFDKANRTSLSSYRGVGMERGLQMLADIRAKWGLRLLTDIHESCQAAPVGEVVDVIQIPAFLCRQTDLLVAAAKTGKTVNIKKAQFLSGEDMKYPYQKAVESGAGEVWLTERGNSFGYNNLVVDFRNIPTMLGIAPRVIMDCTHSVQRPGAAGGKTGGPVCGGVPVIRCHRKQILHALPLQGEDGLGRNRPNKRKTVIFGLPYLVLIGVVVENLLQPEEMPRGGHRIDQMSTWAQHTGKLGLRHR